MILIWLCYTNPLSAQIDVETFCYKNSQGTVFRDCKKFFSSENSSQSLICNGENKVETFLLPVPADWALLMNTLPECQDDPEIGNFDRAAQLAPLHLAHTSTFIDKDHFKWQSNIRKSIREYQRGNYFIGTKIAEDALNFAIGKFGETNIKTLASFDNLAEFYRMQGHNLEANSLLRQSHKLKKTIFRESHPELLNSTRKLVLANKNLQSDAAPTPADYTVLKVYFATDRTTKERSHPSKVFGIGRGTQMTYGSSDVSIPRDHRMGELESPSIWRLEFQEDDKKHVTLRHTEIYSQNEFYKNIASQIELSRKKNAFLFIHGYNVTFENAARRTAQIAYDIGFDGAPIFYSWPSQGTVPAYPIDESNIRWTQSNLRNFLEDFFYRSDAQNIYLIAHSMGNRALTRALMSLVDKQPRFRSRLKEIILTAPDIDADVFRRDIAPRLTAINTPITLYASSEDHALKASKKFHGYPRAGDTSDGLVIVDGIETIDATGVDSGFLKHSYYAENRSVLSDIFHIIQFGHRADERFGLQSIQTPIGRYWTFQK